LLHVQGISVRLASLFLAGKQGASVRDYLIAANWKMHGRKIQVAELIREILSVYIASAPVGVVICPPAPFLSQVEELLVSSSIALGAQNLFAEDSGAYTGEVSGSMLHDQGCLYVIVGHSERRVLFGETDHQVALKVEAAVRNLLVPILCVGESAEERDAGRESEVICRQLEAVVSACGIEVFNKLVVAYEPIWAIGTGNTASPEQAQEVHGMIRLYLRQQGLRHWEKLKVLYGGSVNQSNARVLFEQPDINGALVGGASLSAKEFIAICSAAFQIAARK